MAIDPKALMAINSMEIRVRALIDGLQLGRHRSRQHGFSVEFSEYRNYTHGDDLKHLDWRLMARTDRPYLKRFEAETNLRAQLLVDQSRSMSFASEDQVAKSDYAATLTATLAVFLCNQGDAIGVTTFDDALREHLPPRNHPGHLRRALSILEQPAGGDATDFDEPLRRVAEMQFKRGLFILISDLLAPIEKLGERLTMLRARGNDVAIIRVLDPTEIEPTFEQSTQLRDLESGQSIPVDVKTEIKAYQQRFKEHEATVKKICSEKGIDYLSAITTDPLETVLRDFLGNRNKLMSSAPNRVNSSVRM